MQIVIDIPEKEYEFCKSQWDTECLDVLMIAVKYGTPLPKGHGKLIDADKLKEQATEIKLESLSKNIKVITRYKVENAPTIIEADEESEK